MSIILTIHRVLGEMILPLLIIVVAIWLTITWKPGSGVHPAARFFPVLVDIQVTLGLFYFIYGLITGNSRYFSFRWLSSPANWLKCWVPKNSSC